MNNTVIELHNWRFKTVFGYSNGRDLWRLFGTVEHHPRLGCWKEIAPSTPVSYNEKNETIQTTSGTIYRLMECDGNRKEQIQHIKDCIKNKGYELI